MNELFTGVITALPPSGTAFPNSNGFRRNPHECGITDAGVSCFLKTVRPSNCDDTALAKAAKQEI